jgi:mono/diheme cytochrome c family protein
MTSMPTFKSTHNDEKIWAITAFVAHKLSKMKAKEYKEKL